ncbi:MAG: Glu/Leu/Phe/Val dehydrogenase [Candidatus Riflebacteria bacterium]|nr:Glu/Leu/Phe/Val dehydrogenase [Candidatus Riflebacteria bacterium]
METFELMHGAGLEQIIFFREDSVDLKAVVAIHNTLLGPAIGGIRVMDYPDQESMLKDATELAREMTLRTGLSDCDFGGGSAILCGNSRKGEAYFRAFGRFINRLAGQFYAIMEVGTDSKDLKHIKRETNYVLALPEAFGGIADPTSITAQGLLHGIRATAKIVFGQSSLENVTCLVQGAGRIGSNIVELLVQAKAKLLVSDKNYDRIKNIQDRYPEVSMVRPEEVVDTKCDLIVPCALGNLVNSQTVERLKCRAIAGGASNIIPDMETGELLHKHNILYTPHFLIDSGEVIQADYELKKRSRTLLQSAIGEIYGRTLELLESARENREPPVKTALRLATERFANIGSIGRRISI